MTIRNRTAASATCFPTTVNPHVTMSCQIQTVMGALTEGEARVLSMYYGLDGQEGMTLEEIGTYVGRTRERVRQIKEKALQKLRHPNRSEILKEYYGENA